MTIYYQDEYVRLIHGKFEDHIGDLCGDLIVADPPYGETSLDWDTWPVGWPSIAAPTGSTSPVTHSTATSPSTTTASTSTTPAAKASVTVPEAARPAKTSSCGSSGTDE